MNSERVAALRRQVVESRRRAEILPSFNYGATEPNPPMVHLAAADLADLLDERERLLAVVEAAVAMEEVRTESGTWDRTRTTRHIHVTTDFRAAVRAYRTGEAGQ